MTLETKIDKFVELVIERGRITLNEAARMLDITLEQAEEWAKILNQHKSETGIELHYPSVGEPELVATFAKKKEEITEKVSELKEASEDLSFILEESSKEAEEITRKPLPTKDEFQNLTKRLDEKLSNLKKIETEFEKIKSEISTIEGKLENTEHEEVDVIQKIEKAKTELLETKDDFSNLIELLSQKLKVAAEIKGKLDEIQKLKVDVPKRCSEIESQIISLEREVHRIEDETKNFASRKTKSKLLEFLNKL